MLGPMNFADAGLDETQVLQREKDMDEHKLRGRVGRIAIVSTMVLFGAGVLGMHYSPIVGSAVLGTVAQADSHAEASVAESSGVSRGAVWYDEDGTSIRESARMLFEYTKSVLGKSDGDAIPISTQDEATGAMRIAFRCNSADRVNASRSAWGIKVDVRSSVDGDSMLYYDEYTGYMLSEFLSTMSETNQHAVLELWEEADTDSVLKFVKSATLLERTHFVTSDIEVARELHDADESCSVWLRVDDIDGTEERASLVERGAWLLDGILISCDDMGVDDAQTMCEKIHSWMGRTGLPLTVCVCSEGLDAFVVDSETDAKYIDAGVDFMMQYNVS